MKCLLPLILLSLSPIALLAQPFLTNQPASQTVWVGANAVFTVGASGSGPFTYQWELNQTNLPTNLITTVAGGGIGDHGPATNANLWTPAGVALDARGNIYIADQGHNRVRKFATNGLITTVAGSGNNSAPVAAILPEAGVKPDLSSAYPGDGGPATNALLANPRAVVVDTNGNLLIADENDHRVCQVDTNGIITTLAGNGLGAYAGDGGPATNASLFYPTGLALDAHGNLFIADYGNNVIRKVAPGGLITTVAGTSVYGFSGDGGPATNALFDSPQGVAVDSLGDLFIADAGNQRIRKVDPSGIITSFAGSYTYGFSGDGGLATNALLDSPGDVTVDSNGVVYISDSGNNRVRRVDTNRIITTLAGTNTYGYSGDGGPATNAALDSPLCAALDSHGNLFIADSYNNCIREVTGGIINTVAGNGSYSYSGDGALATLAGLGDLGAVSTDAAGDLFIADLGDGRIRKVGTNGIITTYAGTGTFGYSSDGIPATNAQLNYATGLAATPAGVLYIADEENNRIRKVNTNGLISTIAGTNTAGYFGDGGPSSGAWLSAPSGVALDSAGNLYIADAGNQRIRKVGTNGVITTVAGNGAPGPYLTGTFSGDGGPATNAGLAHPTSVTVDAVGNLFIADNFNYRVRRVATNGIITTYVGTGQYGVTGDGGLATNAELELPYGLVVDGHGNLFIVDSNGDRVREVAPNGIITTFAGSGALTFYGDGGAATNAGLDSPYGICLDPSGNLLITDSGHQRVRKVTSTPPGPNLALTGVTPADAGNYQVIVTGPGGSSLSGVATLVVATEPLVYQASLNANGSLALGLVSPPGSTNLVLTATNLAPPVVWVPLSTNVAGSNGDWQYTATNPTGSRFRFYRSERVSP